MLRPTYILTFHVSPLPLDLEEIYIFLCLSVEFGCYLNPGTEDIRLDHVWKTIFKICLQSDLTQSQGLAKLSLLHIYFGLGKIGIFAPHITA